MSQANTKLEILKAKCRAKHAFLAEHSLIKQDEKNAIKSTSNAVKSADGLEMFEVLDGFLSDWLTIVKLRQEMEIADIQYKMLFRMEGHTDAMSRFVSNVADHCEAMNRLASRMSQY